MDLAPLIDHTILKAEATRADVGKLVDEAKEYGFASVCVNGIFAGELRQALRGTSVKTCVVAGFPLGAMRADAKAIEATMATKDGAQEIDVVAHVPHLLKKDVAATRAELSRLVTDVRDVQPDTVVKVIIESAVLMADVDAAEAEARIEAACAAARESGCDFVKTSTGFHPAGGASVEAIKLMRKHAGPLQVKASGGIRTRDDAMRMIDAGADRLGCSASVAIVKG